MPSVASLPRILTTLFCETATALGRSTGCIQREVKFSGATLAQTLVFGWLATPEGTLEQLCQMAASCGVRVTPQGLDERFTARTATFLQELLAAAVGEVIATDPVAVPLLNRFAGVYLQDCTTVTLPPILASVWRGCGDGTASGHQSVLKAGVRLDLCAGVLQGPVLASARAHDRTLAGSLPPLPPGCLRIADLGFFALADLAALSEQGSFWLTRIQSGTQVGGADGDAHALSCFLATQPAGPIDVTVCLGKSARVPCRILAFPAPPEVADHRLEMMRDEAQRRRQPLTEERVRLVHWTVYATNIPATRLTLTEARVLMRARWQIEMLFKLWKSQIALTRWRTENPWRILCEVYAKLMGCVVQHWLLLTGAWQDPARSLVKASAVIRSFARQLAHALPRTRALRAAVHELAAVLGSTGSVNTRRARPSAAQLLLTPALGALP